MFEEVNKGSCGCLAMFSVSCFTLCLRTFLLLVVDERLLGQKRHCVSVCSGVETSGAARGRMGDVQRGGVETRIWARCYDTCITRARVANAQNRTPANGSSRVERPAATGILSIGADVASAGGGARARARAPGLRRRLLVVVAVTAVSCLHTPHAHPSCRRRSLLAMSSRRRSPCSRRSRTASSTCRRRSSRCS